MAPQSKTVCFTVDVEPDCPPYLSGFRGIEQGMPKLLEMLAEESVPATCFTTGEVAERYPGVVSAIVARGHELACHGMTHRPFTSMDEREARREIEDSARILRRHAPVTSFRAPYLQFPERYLSLLEEAGFELDSSAARYKPRLAARASSLEGRIRRVPASVTSSVLRLPKLVRETYLRALASPVVLFVHPWELVDLTGERLRIDCRFRTGDVALDCARDVIRSFARRGARFTTMSQLSAA